MSSVQNDITYNLVGGSTVTSSCSSGKVMTGYVAKLMPWELYTSCIIVSKFNGECKGSTSGVKTLKTNISTSTACIDLCRDNPTCSEV